LKSASAPQPKVYQVSELTRAIKTQLEREFVSLWVTGEISNCKHHSSGHLYFTLKDNRSQIPAVMFRSSNRLLRFRPADGLAVMAYGFVTVYEPRGQYQLQVERMEPRGKGELQLAFEQLKEKLAREGLFDAARKKPLPLLPRRIGIVTSPSGAALRDICRILHLRFPNLELVLYPAQVQGDLAGFEIATGIRMMNRLGGFDVLIVGRGGGSLEDLWPFNEEGVARAISTSRIPVISAVGHETDFTIADFVADVRAATPSAAAEMVVARKEHFLERVTNLERELGDGLGRWLETIGRRVERLAEHQAFGAVRHRVAMSDQRLDEARFRARASIDRRLQEAGSHWAGAFRHLEALRPDRRLKEARARLEHLSALLSARDRARRTAGEARLGETVARLEALSPLAVLGRGYSLTWNQDGELVRDATRILPGEPVRVTLHRGRLDCRVEVSYAENGS
jgi:exodeoxyribonuclease VII large subunit